MHKKLNKILKGIEEIKGTLNIPKQNEYLDVKQVAELTGLSKHTIYKYVEFRHIPVLRIRGILRFKRNEILDWIESKRTAVAQ